jgi:hypothetical protein
LEIRIDRGTRGLKNTGTRYRLVIGMTDSRLGISIAHFTWFSGLRGAEIASQALKTKERGSKLPLNTPCPADPSQGRLHRDVPHSQPPTSPVALLT